MFGLVDLVRLRVAMANSSKRVIDNGRGAIWMIASGLTYSVAMALVKLLGDDYSSAVENAVRQFMGLLFLTPFILRNPRAAFTMKRPVLMICRCAATSLSIVLSFNSFHALGLAEANALSFTRALFLVPLAAVLLGEGMDRQRIFATVSGFGGVLVILSPGSGASLIGWPAAQGLLAALLVSWSIISVKTMSRDHGELALLTWSALLGMILTAPFAAADWTTPTGTDMLLLAVMGVLGIVTQGCYIRGMALGEASVMAPLDYVRILFISALGYTMFAEVPSLNVYIGSAIIIVTALYVTLHSRRRDLARKSAVEVVP